MAARGGGAGHRGHLTRQDVTGSPHGRRSRVTGSPAVAEPGGAADDRARHDPTG